MLQSSNRIRLRARALLVLTTLTLAACFPIKFDARMPLPEPLITKMPFVVAVHIPPEFKTFVQKEKRDGLKWEIGLGQAQTEGFSQLLNAMFERVLVVDSVEAAIQAGQPVRAILEPTIDEYAFVTSRETGSPFFAVSIKYRMAIYTPEGKLADSWAFTGYGSATTAGMSDEDSLSRATTLALRDAAAKLAVEFRDQEIVRELLPPDGTSPTRATEGSSEPRQAEPAPEVPVEAEPQSSESGPAPTEAPTEAATPQGEAPATTESPASTESEGAAPVESDAPAEREAAPERAPTPTS